MSECGLAFLIEEGRDKGFILTAGVQVEERPIRACIIGEYFISWAYVASYHWHKFLLGQKLALWILSVREKVSAQSTFFTDQLAIDAV